MPYRSPFEFRNGGIGPYLGAIPFAAIGSACIGVTVFFIWALLIDVPWGFSSSFGELAFGLIGILAIAGIAVTAATFVVGAYLAMFGLPVAILLGRHIHNLWALMVALLDAGASALFAVTGNRIGAFESDGPSLLLYL